MIVDVEATTSVRQAEVLAQRRMIERTQERFGLWPERLVADTAYGSAPNLAWLVEDKGIEPHIPVFDKSARSDGTLARSDFTYDAEDDSYLCPGGKRLKPSNRNFKAPRPLANADGFIRYRASQKDCQACNLKQRCAPRTATRKIVRSVHEGARDLARDISKSDAYLVSRRQRKKVEMLFAHLKRIRTHPVKAAAVLYIVVGDERCEVFDAVFGKCHRAVRTIKAVHPDQPVFRVHARREFSNQIFFDA